MGTDHETTQPHVQDIKRANHECQDPCPDRVGQHPLNNLQLKVVQGDHEWLDSVLGDIGSRGPFHNILKDLQADPQVFQV